ncbi:MAG: hypothetical protein L6435_14520 [Anaerolineae bacterium]|nr:hypothetical protein [Anaerolineae bacterium]
MRFTSPSSGEVPRHRAKCRREIEHLRESSAHYQRELEELRAHVSGEPPTAIRDIVAQLQQMDTKLDTLLGGQAEVILAKPARSGEVEHLSEVIDAPKLYVRHKLKINMTMIPLPLSYEGEIALGNGMNLDAAWKRLVARVRGAE